MDSRFYRLAVSVAACSALLAQTPAPKRPTPATPAAPIDPKPATPAAAAPAASPDRVVITIGDEKITAAQFEELIENLPEQYRAMARGPARRQFLDQVINMKGLASEARKRKLDQSPGFKRQLAFQADNVLAALLYQDLASNAKVDDAALREHFDQHKNEYEQCRARHILIRTKDSPMPQVPGQSELTDEQAKEKAAALKKRIVGGEDFATVAKAESDDTTTRPAGGDLGQFRRGSMVPPFDQAAFSLPVKEVSDPVRTPYGYHIIQVESRESKTFDEVKREIEKKIRPEKARQAVDELRKGIKVEVDEAYFGPARQ